LNWKNGIFNEWTENYFHSCECWSHQRLLLFRVQLTWINCIWNWIKIAICCSECIQEIALCASNQIAKIRQNFRKVNTKRFLQWQYWYFFWRTKSFRQSMFWKQLAQSPIDSPSGSVWRDQRQNSLVEPVPDRREDAETFSKNFTHNIIWSITICSTSVWWNSSQAIQYNIIQFKKIDFLRLSLAE
jgi:hypothetical protein